MGYYQYHAVPGNLDRLRIFGQRLRRLWRLVPSRRSDDGMLPWDRPTPIFNRWIPITRVLHPYKWNASPLLIRGGRWNERPVRGDAICSR